MLRIIRAVIFLCAGIGIAISATAQDQTKAVKISDSIYMAPTVGNVYLVATPAGNVIIDTASANQNQAATARQLLGAVSPGPVKYIIKRTGNNERRRIFSLSGESGKSSWSDRH